MASSLPSTTSLLVITGSMGSGKTTVMAEASDILTLAGVPHAAIDFDALAVAHFPSQVIDEGVACRNLRCVWENFRARGLTKLLLAAAVESRVVLDGLRDAVSASETKVCRLMASLATMQERVRARETGVWHQKYVDRVTDLEALVQAAALEDYFVVNDNRPVTDVAREVLVLARWIS